MENKTGIEKEVLWIFSGDLAERIEQVMAACKMDVSSSGSDENRKRNRRSLHCATPDFLSRLKALANVMRLSLLKAAHAGVGECRVAGNPGTLRFHGKPGQAG
jgi:hypothetical protein